MGALGVRHMPMRANAGMGAHGRNGPPTGPEPMNRPLNHALAAQQLDHVLAAAVALDRALTAAGYSTSAPESLRLHSLAMFEHLANLRTALDRSAVAAGLHLSRSPYVRRDLAPCLETRTAARAAQRAAWAADAAEQDQRSANLVRPKRGTPSPPPGHEPWERPAPLTGDDHRQPNLDIGRQPG